MVVLLYVIYRNATKGDKGKTHKLFDRLNRRKSNLLLFHPGNEIAFEQRLKKLWLQ